MRNCALLLCFLSTLCIPDRCLDTSYPIWIQNDSNKSIHAYYTLNIQDTTLSFLKEDILLYKMIPPNTKGSYPIAIKPLPEWLSTPKDTLRVFIFDNDTLEAYPWDDIQNNYRILIRYDLIGADIDELDEVIYYPPTPEMQYVKMYPPYSEEEEEGF